MRLWAIGLVHAGLLASALSPADDLWSRPIRNVDYTMHLYTARHMADRLAAAGRLWGYDPGWMAGFPDSMVALVDNKLFGVVLLLAPRDLEAAAFNATVLVALLSVPWVLHGAARAAGSTAGEANGAALAGTALTFGAPLTVLFWTGGGISFVLASLLAVPAALGLTGALAEDRLFSARGLAAAALAALAVFAHMLAVLPLGAALAPRLWARPVRLRSLASLGALAAFLGITMAPVVAGLEENIAHIHHTPRGGASFPGGILALVLDWWTHLLRTPDDGFLGAGSLAAVVALAISGMRAPASAERTAARRALLAGAAGCAFLAYLAPALLDAGALQAHRFVIPLGFFAAVPAGWGLARVFLAFRERRLGAWALALLLAAIVAESTWALSRIRVLGSGVDRAEPEIAKFLAESGDDGGRVLVEIAFAVAPAAPGSSRQIGMMRFTLLPLEHQREFLGTDHMDIVIAERYATFYDGRLLGHPLEKFDHSLLRQILDRYAVSTVVACTARTRRAFERFREVLEPVRDLADCRGYRVRDAVTSRLLEGRGEARARLDRIEVRSAEGERLVLKYHWIPALRTEPPLPIEEARQPGAAVGFIAVRPGGVRDFDIFPVRTRGIAALLLGALRRALDV